MSFTILKKNPSPGEITSSLTGSTGDGAGLHFNGIAGNIDIASPPDLGTKFSFEFIIKCDAFGTFQQNFVDFGTGGRFVIASNSSMSWNLGIYDQTSWKSFGVKVLDDLKVHHLCVTIDGTIATLFDNGNQVATVTISSGHAIDSCTDAKIGSAFNGSGDFVEGTYYRARFYNHTLSADDVRTAYERADVDFADQYGSQTSKILNGTSWTGASGTTPPTSWTVGTAGTFTIDSSSGSGSEPALKITRNSNNPYIYQTFSAVVGKQYRVKYRAKNVDATHVRVGIGSSAIGTQYNATDTTATSWQDFEQTYTATTTTFSVYVQLATTTGTQSGYIDSLTVEQVGVVTDLDLAFASPTQSLTVQDRAGLADGTCSASGVTQVQPVVQGNLTSLAVTTSQQAAGVPADGDIVASGTVKGSTLKATKVDSTDQLYLERTNSSTGKFYLGAAANSFFIVDDAQSQTRIKIDNTGGVQIGGDGTARELRWGNTYANNGPTIIGHDVNGTFQFYPAGNGSGEAMKLSSDKLATFYGGIAFSQTNTSATGATATGTTLGHYEEGTFTASLTFGGGDTGITYALNSNKGIYTRIGNMVYISLVVELTNKGTSTGTALITGLPFIVSDELAATSLENSLTSSFNNIGLAYAYAAGGSTPTIYMRNSSHNAVTSSDFSNSSSIRLAGWYTTP